MSTAVLLAVALLAPPTAAPADAARPVVPSGPRHRGVGLSVAGGVLGVVWVSLKIAVSVNDSRVAREYDRGGNPGCIESCYVGAVIHPIAAVGLVGSAALLGGGMHVHGRWLARRGRGLGRSARTGKILAGVGGGLLGTAAIGLGLGLGLQHLSGLDQRQQLLSRELGWWSATVFGISGAALAGLGHGILRGGRERRGEIHVAPMLGPRLPGVSLSGRF